MPPPGATPTVEKGTATRKMILDGRVMAEETKSQMHGQPFTGHGMHGYDNVTGKTWGTWSDSMSTRWPDPNTEVFEMYTPGPDGNEMKMMEIVYTKRAN